MKTDQIDAYLTQVQSTLFMAAEDKPHSFAYMVRYYLKGAPKKRNQFRIASTLVIVISALLPAAAALGPLVPQWLGKDLLVSLMSVSVAALTGILAHYRWEVGWRSQNEALFALETLRAVWESEVAKARAMPEEPDALKNLVAAYERFQRQSYEVVHAEMGEFFKVQQAPNGNAAERKGG